MNKKAREATMFSSVTRQKYKRAQHLSLRASFLILLTFFVIIAGSTLISTYISDLSLLNLLKEKQLSAGSALGQTFEEGILSIIATSIGIEGFVLGNLTMPNHNGSFNERMGIPLQGFEEIAQKLLKFAPEIWGVGLAPSGIMSLMYPNEDLSFAIDLLSKPGPWTTILRKGWIDRKINIDSLMANNGNILILAFMPIFNETADDVNNISYSEIPKTYSGNLEIPTSWWGVSIAILDLNIFLTIADVLASTRAADLEWCIFQENSVFNEFITLAYSDDDSILAKRDNEGRIISPSSINKKKKDPVIRADMMKRANEFCYELKNSDLSTITPFYVKGIDHNTWNVVLKSTSHTYMTCLRILFIIIISLMCSIVGVLIIDFVYVFMFQKNVDNNAFAPKIVPFVFTIITLFRGDRLWEDVPDEALDVVYTFEKKVRKSMLKHNVYEASHDAAHVFCMSSRSVRQAVHCTFDIIRSCSEIKYSPTVAKALRQDYMSVCVLIHNCTDASVSYDIDEKHYQYIGNDVIFAGKQFSHTIPNFVVLTAPAASIAQRIMQGTRIEKLRDHLGGHNRRRGGQAVSDGINVNKNTWNDKSDHLMIQEDAEDFFTITDPHDGKLKQAREDAHFKLKMVTSIHGLMFVRRRRNIFNFNCTASELKVRRRRDRRVRIRTNLLLNGNIGSTNPSDISSSGSSYDSIYDSYEDEDGSEDRVSTLSSENVPINSPCASSSNSLFSSECISLENRLEGSGNKKHHGRRNDGKTHQIVDIIVDSPLITEHSTFKKQEDAEYDENNNKLGIGSISTSGSSNLSTVSKQQSSSNTDEPLYTLINGYKVHRFGVTGTDTSQQDVSRWINIPEVIEEELEKLYIEYAAGGSVGDNTEMVGIEAESSLSNSTINHAQTKDLTKEFQKIKVRIFVYYKVYEIFFNAFERNERQNILERVHNTFNIPLNQSTLKHLAVRCAVLNAHLKLPNIQPSNSSSR